VIDEIGDAQKLFIIQGLDGLANYDRQGPASGSDGQVHGLASHDSDTGLFQGMEKVVVQAPVGHRQDDLYQRRNVSPLVRVGPDLVDNRFGLLAQLPGDLECHPTHRFGAVVSVLVSHLVIRLQKRKSRLAWRLTEPESGGAPEALALFEIHRPELLPDQFAGSSGRDSSENQGAVRGSQEIRQVFGRMNRQATQSSTDLLGVDIDAAP